MQVIPVSAMPSQTLAVTLAGQTCAINLYQKSTGLYADVLVAGVPIVQGVLCRDRVKLVRHAYLGFIGDLAICDMQGLTDPTYDGLGSRYLLIYLEAADL